jgi:hypothetical protein
MGSSSSMIIIVMLVGVAALCFSSSAGMGVAYWQNWLCDSLGEDFGNDCKKKDDDGDESSDPPPDDQTPSDSKDEDEDKDNSNMSKLRDKYSWLFNKSGSTKSRRFGMAIDSGSCSGKSLGVKTNDALAVMDSNDAKYCGWKLSGKKDNYKLRFFGNNTKYYPKNFKSSNVAFNISSGNSFKIKAIKGKNKGKYLNVNPKNCSSQNIQFWGGFPDQFGWKSGSATKFKFVKC